MFTQEGVAMLSSVLRRTRAVRANIALMRAFVRLREALNSTAKLEELEKKYDVRFKNVFDTIKALMPPLTC